MIGVVAFTMPAVTAKVAEAAPGGTSTLAGTLATSEDELSVIITPPLNAADVSVSVHVDVAHGINVSGLQERPLRLGLWRIVTVPSMVDVGMARAAASADAPLTS